MNNNNGNFIKICVCGEGGVGKTSFLNRVINNVFDEEAELTKGVEFFNKKIQMSHHGKVYDLIFWDFGGQDRFRKLLLNFVDGSSVAVFLFDMTRFSTLDKLEEWMSILFESGNIPLLILGAKEDQVDEKGKASFTEMLETITDSNDQVFGHLLISNKTGFNIDKALDMIIEKLNDS
ncbi:MAG: Small GTP-binding domain protein [Promethearchaeota archaeon]|nr:MAG: Small GTP-binding domain protein [Candidatus Lokiarchaeota archaeon]